MTRHVCALVVCAALCAAGCSRDPAQAGSAFIASGDRYAQQGKYPEAAIEYRNGIKLEPASADAHANNLAWIYLDEGRLDEALGDAVVAKAGLGRAPEVNDTLGWIYYKRHQPKLAIPPLTESVQARPDNALYRSHLDAARRALLSR